MYTVQHDLALTQLDTMCRTLRARLRRHAKLAVGEDLADDVVQETFLRAAKSYRTKNPNSPNDRWLLKIQARVIADMRSTTDSRSQVESLRDCLRHALMENLDLVRADRRLHLEQLIERLDPRDAGILILKGYMEYSWDEIVARTGRTHGEVRAAYGRAKENLKRALG